MGLRNYAVLFEGNSSQAGELLARGHARSGDACQIYGYYGSGVKIGKALLKFATGYANQTEADYRAFVGAIKGGSIKVAS